MNKSCPCEHGFPCNPKCTCVNPVSSTGCLSCCRYDSSEQQKLAAQRLAGQLDLIRELRQRERTLIDLCHRVDAGLQKFPQSPDTDRMLTDLETVRMWWYPKNLDRSKVPE